MIGPRRLFESLFDSRAFCHTGKKSPRIKVHKANLASCPLSRTASIRDVYVAALHVDLSQVILDFDTSFLSVNL